MVADRKSLFLRALRLPPAERWPYLMNACGSDHRLRCSVAELLSYHGQSGDLLDPGELDDLAHRYPLNLPERLGEYAIEGIVGVGGLGVVYEARRAGGVGPEGPAIALKVLRGAMLSTDARRRFRREAEALARLDHPGIARLVDSGVFDTPEGGLPFVATELVAGVSLREWVARERPDHDRVIEMLRRTTEAVNYAHSLGIIHRDLKPENILVDEQGAPRVLDFGLARLVDGGAEAASQQTRVGQVIGTVPYMSPEQAQAGPDPVDERADLYSLGVIGYELLAGRLPIEIPNDSLHRAIVSILTTEPRPLGEWNSACRGDTEYVVGRLLAKRPADRHANARSLLADLDALLAGRRAIRPRPVARSGRSSRMTAALATLAIVIAGLLALVMTQRLPGSASSPGMRAAIAASMRHLARAHNLMHAGDGSESLIREGLAQLDSAEVRLQALPGNLPLSNLRRVLYWRQGEGHYFLGTMLDSKEELWAARSSWEWCWGQCNRPFSPALIDSTMEGFREVRDLSPDPPVGGLVLVHMALAGYERPLTHLRKAAEFAEQTWLVAGVGADSLPWRGETATQRDRLHGYCMTLNNRSFIRARLGYVQGDSAAIDAGLAGLREADERWPTLDVVEPRGAHLHNYGRAWRFRGVVTGRVADFDSAESVFRRALGFREAAQFPRAYALTQYERARVVLNRPRPTVDELRLSLSRVRTARAVSGPDATSLVLADGELLEAELLIELALRGAPGDMTTADSLLAAATGAMPVGQFPLQHVEALRVGARLNEVRGRLRNDPAARHDAARQLDEALELTSPIEEPFRYAGLVRRRDLLLSAPDRARAEARPGRMSTGS